MPPRRRAATSTSNFGVGRRESHVADAFYARFEAPELSDDEHVTPHEAGRGVCLRRRPSHGRGGRQLGGARGDLAAVLRRQAVRGGARPRGRAGVLHRVPRAVARRLRRLQARARAGRSHRRQRGEPGTQAVSEPVGGRHVDPAGRPPPVAEGRDHLAEGRRGERLVRLGLVPLGGQPGVARRDRAGPGGEQGPLRPGPVTEGAPARRPAASRARSAPTTSWR